MQPLQWFRRRRSSTGAREKLFVVRQSELGPELYLVGRGVRRLATPQRHDRDAWRSKPPPTGLAFARRMLAEVMYCRPATQLARAFADAHLEPLPADGFVLSTSDVEAWLGARHARLEPAQSSDPPRGG